MDYMLIMFEYIYFNYRLLICLFTFSIMEIEICKPLNAIIYLHTSTRINWLIKICLTLYQTKLILIQFHYISLILNNGDFIKS